MKPIKSADNRRLDGTFGPNNNANPDGRPKEKTIKERVREYLEQHPTDMAAFVKHFVEENRELAWQMLEGRPAQEVTGKDGKDLFSNEEKESAKKAIKNISS